MNLILVGAPGSGKGTQARCLAARLGIPQMATGDMLRDQRRAGTVLGEQVRAYMDRGELAPDAVMIDMIAERLQAPDAQRGFILDGFPRNRTQAEALDQTLARLGRRVDRVLYLRVSAEELTRRLGSRYTCPLCGTVYNSVTKPPRRPGICDRDGRQLYQRVDDADEVTRRRRIAVFFEETLPIVEYYRQQGKLLEVDGEQPVETVRQIIDTSLDSQRG